MSANDDLIDGLRRLRAEHKERNAASDILDAAIRALSAQQPEAVAWAEYGRRPFAYSQVTPTDDPDVLDHRIYLLPPGCDVPEGCVPLYIAKQPQGAVSEFPARFVCNGPEGTFYANDGKFANRLIVETFDRNEWTVTDTTLPPACRENTP